MWRLCGLARGTVARRTPCGAPRVPPLLGARVCSSTVAPPTPIKRGEPLPGRTEADIEGEGPLRGLPRWDRVGVGWEQLSGSAARFIDGKERRIEEFGVTKQWKTLSEREAAEQFLLRRADLEGLPFVAKYNVYGTPRLTRFYVVFDVQDRALAKWGSAAALGEAHGARRRKRERRVARLQPPALMLMRPVRARKGIVVVGSRAVGAAIVGNTGVVIAKLGGWVPRPHTVHCPHRAPSLGSLLTLLHRLWHRWAISGSGAMLSEAFHSMADLGNQVPPPCRHISM